MKNILIVLLSFGTLSLARAQAPAPASLMSLSTTAFADGAIIPVKFSQAAPGAAPGEGTSPALKWSDVPAGTQSFVLHMHDLDFVRNKTTDDQVHWLVWNIPGDSKGLPEGLPRGETLPDGSYQISVTGQVYRGPGAAANGPLHHYMFELFALDTKLDVKPAGDAFATRKAVMQAMEGHVLGRAAYGGRFRRP
ncbi:MAG: YbhB/YbcL family Raf kinase inhibitor-like protein [Daejeonella sp.]|uniref:YbhB/YbcL family Raf kinase inhibitor-like protein n=1 Tax=Daejeonella sp. JGW-45 TaxID=3034148 RepID=UPI0023EBA9EE|nr:YbhB/YbcL family Raf kinase inhibitor-like protein [Daejeonella sp. JGW-45]